MQKIVKAQKKKLVLLACWAELGEQKYKPNG
jgi:hypothetical protein